MDEHTILEEVEGLYRIVALKTLRRTPGVRFDMVRLASLLRIDAIDRVIHEGGAVSPGPVSDVARPWYMHTHQDDNLLVLHGTRTIEIYTPAHGRIERFTVNRGPHVDKKSMEQFEVRTHKRMLDIIEPTAKTVDELKKLNLPAGVDITIKI